MRKLINLSLASALICTGSLHAWVKGPQHRTLRPLAMGNAFVALVDDKDAMHYNPAGLNLMNRLGNKEKNAKMGHYPLDYFDMHMNFLGAGLPLNTAMEILEFYQDHSSSFNDFETLQSDPTLSSDLSKFDRQPVRFSALHGGELAFHNFGMSYWLDAELAPYADVGVLIPQAGVDYVKVDLVGEIAGAYSLMDGRMSVGAEYRMAKREILGNTQLALTDLSTIQQVAQDSLDQKLENVQDITTIGHGFDFGLLWQQDPSLRFGGVIQNLAMRLNHDWVMPELTIGVAYSPTFLQNNRIWKRKINFAADLEDLLWNEKNYKPLSKINLGMEWEQTLIPFVLKGRLSAGIKGGYLTAGLGGNLFTVLHYEFATWAEEDGYYTGHIENRYYVMKFGIGL